MSKRGRGEGSLEQLPSGKWRAIYTNGKRPDGSQRKVAATFDRHRDAAAWLAEQLDARNKGRLCEPSRMTLDVWLKQWLKAIKLSLQDLAYDFNEEVCRNFLLPELGDVELGQLSPLLINEMVGRLLEGGKSHDRVAKVLRVLGAACKAACKHKLIYQNPVGDAAKPRHDHKEMKCWTLAEARQFLASTIGLSRHALYSLALDGGMRQGEMLGLHWPDVDLVEGCVNVRQSLQQRGYEFKLKPTKTAKGRRRIYLGEHTAEELKAHRERLRARGRDVVRGKVFPSKTGGWISKATVNTDFIKAIASAGLPRIRFHDMRHTNATLLLNAGVGIKTVSERLGHADVSITLRVYTHVLLGEQRSVAAVSGRLFTPSHSNPTQEECCTNGHQNELPQVQFVIGIEDFMRP